MLDSQNKSLLSKFEMKQSVALSYLNQTNGLFLRLLAVGLIFLVGGITILTSTPSYHVEALSQYPDYLPSAIIVSVGLIFLLFALKMALRASKQTELEKKIIYYQEKMINTGTFIRDYYIEHRNTSPEIYTHFHKFQRVLYYASLFLISAKSQKLFDDLRYHPRGKTLFGASGDTAELGEHIIKILSDYVACDTEYCKQLRKKLGNLEILIQEAMDDLDIEHKKPTTKYKITHLFPRRKNGKIKTDNPEEIA